jgi:uroporphyrin-III C-methyltransferase/precorrin-2 dehydrogenase/sirohydrochlorin ferrochelatase
MRNLLPLFLDLAGRDVLLVGGGRVASAKLQQLVAAAAHVRVVSPVVLADIERLGRFAPIDIIRRAFQPADVDGVWLVVAAATPEVNRAVASAAEARRVFVNAVDDPENASAYLSGVVRRDDVTIAISTAGDAPALTSLVREALDAVLPDDLHAWVHTAREQRAEWRRGHVPMDARKPLLLRALNTLYASNSTGLTDATHPTNSTPPTCPTYPWLSGPEDSWL